jgi:hypothetical protein
VFRNCVFVVALAFLAGGTLAIEQSAPSAKPPAFRSDSAQRTKPGASELGTKSVPVAVEITNIPRLEISSAPTLRVESTDRTPPKPDSYWTPEWMVALATVILAAITGALARYTFKLYRATVNLSSDAKLSAEQQTQRMERSITEAARAATAMEAVAKATTENTKLVPTLLTKQMRAYLSVETGIAGYQDANNRFAAAPVITNNGLTPARNVRWLAMANVIDGRSPATTQFPPIGELPESDMGIAPRQTFTLNAIMPDRVPDAEVEEIKMGSPRRLFCWGKVKYDDVYGGSWETNFCVNYNFYLGEDGKTKVNGWVYPRHNGAT